MEEKTYLVLFWGNMIPLQGVPYIRRAAELLWNEPIEIQILGDPKVPQHELPDRIRKADICLGIFGDTDKATRVIPNKVYEAIAMKKAVISADTPAIRELFSDRENILLCKRASPESLAEKIKELCENQNLRNHIAEGGYRLFQERATPKIIGKELLDILCASKI